jgi:aspartate racemase
MTKKKKIGILGGLGPESTGKFYLDLIRSFEETRKPKNNTEFPHIIVNSIPAPELIFDRVDRKILNYYIRELQELEKAGCGFIVIVCNTAYSFLDQFQQTVKIPIINLPKELEKRLATIGAKTVTRLVTPTGYSHGLYKFNRFTYNEVSQKELMILEDAIAKFNVGKEKKKQIARVTKIYDKYAEISDAVILGCTELALMLADKKGVNTVDPMQELVKAVLSRL